MGDAAKAENGREARREDMITPAQHPRSIFSGWVFCVLGAFLMADGAISMELTLGRYRLGIRNVPWIYTADRMSRAISDDWPILSACAIATLGGIAMLWYGLRRFR